MATDTTCPHCGEPLALPEMTGGGKRRVVCERCGKGLELVVSVDGGETLFQPQLLVDEAATERPAGGSATRPVGSATTLLDAPSPEGTGSEVRTIERACLVVTGALPGSERLPLDAGRTVVGREGADLEVADAAISNRHFEIERRGREYFLRDLGSSNGTTVNGHRIRAVQLRPGDTIRAGRTTFTFRVFEAIAL